MRNIIESVTELLYMGVKHSGLYSGEIYRSSLSGMSGLKMSEVTIIWGFSDAHP